jgi:hypothetical protein
MRRHAICRAKQPQHGPDNSEPGAEQQQTFNSHGHSLRRERATVAIADVSPAALLAGATAVLVLVGDRAISRRDIRNA